jgi:hypothetical protein
MGLRTAGERALVTGCTLLDVLDNRNLQEARLMATTWTMVRKAADRVDAARNTDEYWPEQEALNTVLRQALADRLPQRLKKPQLFKFIQLCSSHRPHAPHVILMDLAKTS